jgi:crossover junction endodeoxyribonuclease RusA
MNARHHWAAKSRITRDIRETTKILAMANHLPRGLDHVTVCLHYAPKTNRRIDADNLVATLKPCCDGLVDYGLVDDDVPAQMAKLMPVIHPKSTTGKGQLWLEIEVTP